MAEILDGRQVAAVIDNQTRVKVNSLKSEGLFPTLAILRVGEKKDDLSYEQSAVKKGEALGIQVKTIALPENVSQDNFDQALKHLNEDNQVHGILMFRPLPSHLDNEKARKLLAAEKDIDGCTDGSLAGVFTNSPIGFCPCTAQAAIEILDHYQVECKGKQIAVLGRSLVVGRPVAMKLLHKDATPTLCHTKTRNLAHICQNAEILIACTGKMESIGAELVHEGQTIIDVGIGWNEEKHKLCGDVDFQHVEPIVSAITPVPGGVGSVTTSVLFSHVAEAAERQKYK